MSIHKPIPRYTRLASALLAGLFLPGLATAQSASPDNDSSAKTLDKVTVTGSRIARSEIEGPTPVTVITAEEIRKQGFSTVWESLGTLTQFTGSAMNEADQTGDSPNGQYINLRGLGPGYQLILLNGQRLADYPQSYGSSNTAVSLGSIPAAAVERIEVMSGGASAIYGSDAVAGVINIITKTDFEGDTVRIRAGTTTRGGGDTGLIQWSGGRTGDRWSLTYALERLDRESIVAAQRDFMDSYWDHPSNRANPEKSTASISGVYFRTGSTYRWLGDDGNLSTSYQALAEACARTSAEFTPFYSSTSSAQPNRCGAYGYYEGRSVQNKYGKSSAYVAGTFDFNDDLQGYAQFLASSSKDESSSQTHYYIGETPFTVEDPVLGRVTAQRIFLPSEVGGIKTIQFEEKAWNLNAGLRGTMFDGRFDWDASVTMSRFDITTKRPRFLTNAIRDYYLGPLQGYTSDGVEIRQFYVDRLFAPATPDLYDRLTTQVVSKGESATDQAQFVLSGKLFELPAGAVEMAAVIEASTQDYELKPDERVTVDYTGPERIYNLTQTPGGGTRDRMALGLEFRVPILDTLAATVAGRYDKYDDITSVDDALTWQASLEWRPLKNLLIRGTHATSFRAPDLLWIYAGTSASNPFIVDEYLCRLNGMQIDTPACENAYEYQTFLTQSSNPKLEEETGKSTTIGFVWDILPNLSTSVDYYEIELEGQVRALTNTYQLEQNANCLLGKDRDGKAVDGTSAACQFYTSTVQRRVSDLNPEGRITQFHTSPINASLVRTSGVDATVKYRWDTESWGNYNFQVGYTHVLDMEMAQFADEEPIDVRNNVEYNSFRTRANWRLGWARDEWTASLYAYRYGSRTRYNTTNDSSRLPAYTIWNLDFAKQITDKMTIGMSVLNLLDDLAPEDKTHTAWPYFPRVYSPIGRQVLANVTYNF